MMTASQFLKALARLGEIKTAFRFPYVQVVLVNDTFADKSALDREGWIAKNLKIEVGDIRSIALNSLLSLQPMTSKEAKSQFGGSLANRGFHWLSALINPPTFFPKMENTAHKTAPKVIHFYGYKGGQARSTLLALVASALANDGWRVLAIDSDIEAPSLDSILGRTSYSVSGTLMGATRTEQVIQPETAYVAERTGGHIDLLACRPRSQEYDVDAAAFALRAAMDPNLIRIAAERLITLSQTTYDAILIDHRAGLSPTTFTWLNTVPGPTVICVKLDEQWRSAKNFFRLVLQSNPELPGIFVSWKPDDESEETFRRRNNAQIDEILEVLANVVAVNAEPSEQLSAVELFDHLVVWPYDNAFRTSRFPELSDIGKTTSDKLSDIRTLLNMNQRRATGTPSVVTSQLSPSGAADEGDLIQTDALRHLMSFSSPISYIFGRKGTGKTRLVRELERSGFGEPLLVAADSSSGFGVKSTGPEMSNAVRRFEKDPIQLWWCLFAAAVATERTNEATLRRELASAIAGAKTVDFTSLALQRISIQKKRRVFLLDGLETAFSARNVFTNIEALFKFLLAVQSDPRFSELVQFKLFLRTDLALRGYQNIEQQINGREIRLFWNTQKIFNFLLSRIPHKHWIAQKFPQLVDRIREKTPAILHGELSVEECQELLFEAFPEKLRRNNLSTATFLRTYFADSATDSPEKLTYYPRIFDAFLDVVDRADTDESHRFSGERLEEGRISQGLIIFAQESAADVYLKQLLSELNYLLTLSKDPAENESRVRDLLNNFSGLQTPFDFDEMIQQLAKRTSLEQNVVRSAMQRMKSLGMFEDRPGYPGQWRVGRLFKSSLKMKYVR